MALTYYVLCPPSSHRNKQGPLVAPAAGREGRGAVTKSWGKLPWGLPGTRRSDPSDLHGGRGCFNLGPEKVRLTGHFPARWWRDDVGPRQ